MNTKLTLSFGRKMYNVKAELERRADAMNMSASKYCIMVLTRHVSSGEKFRITND